MSAASSSWRVCALRSPLRRLWRADTFQRVLTPVLTEVLKSTPLDAGMPGAAKCAPVLAESAPARPALAPSITCGRHSAAACWRRAAPAWAAALATATCGSAACAARQACAKSSAWAPAAPTASNRTSTARATGLRIFIGGLLGTHGLGPMLSNLARAWRRPRGHAPRRLQTAANWGCCESHICCWPGARRRYRP